MTTNSAQARSCRAVLMPALIALFAATTSPLVASDSGRDLHPREAFVEDLGPRFPADWTDAASRPISGNAHHWSELAGVPFIRDVHIDLRGVPLDLDADGRVDITVSRKVDLKGGMLANPDVFGLVATPDDPAGKPGLFSISTGFSGIREEMDPVSRKGTGRYGFSCSACHGGVPTPGARGVYGYPSASFDWGLALAGSDALTPDFVIDLDRDGKPDAEGAIAKRHRLEESARLDLDRDGKVTIREFRGALRYEPCESVQARLLLAGPGRLDLSHEFGQDETVPGIMRIAYAEGVDDWVKRLRPAYFNPVSVPSVRGLAGVAALNHSGNDTSLDIDYVERVGELTGKPLLGVASWLGTDSIDRSFLNRLIAIDKRIIETFAQDADYWPGLAWSDALSLDRDMESAAFLEDVPASFNTRALREALLAEPPDVAHPSGLDPAKVARGREIFSRSIVGKVRNQHVLFRPPAEKAVEGLGRNLYLAPIDATRPLSDLIDVKCATCHNYTCSEARVDMRKEPDVHARCAECHAPCPKGPTGTAVPGDGPGEAGWTVWNEASCARCHDAHPAFGYQSYSRTFLMPFDTDGDGVIRGDEADDGRAGGIGTDSMYMVNPQHLVLEYVGLDDGANPPRVEKLPRAFGWIRVSPLRGTFATAPYLHNGSVPTLGDLLRKPEDRPKTFAVGNPSQGFVFDTALPGNRNTGHAFGTELSEPEKDALVEFLRSL